MTGLTGRAWQIIIAIMTMISVGCGHTEFLGMKPPITYAIKGDVKDNYYVSPNKSFRILMPHLLKPGAKVQDEQLPGGVWHVSMTDDLCREYIVLENLFGTQYDSVDAWIDNHYTPMFQDPKYNMIDRKYVQTKYGQGVMLRWNQKEAAPCVQITFKDGNRVTEKPDAEVGLYIIRIGDYAYRFLYVNDPETVLFSSSLPTEEELVKFISGFELINPSEKGR